MTIDEMGKLIRQTFAVKGRLCLTIEGYDVSLDKDGIFAKPDDGIKVGLVCLYMAYMVNEVVKSILDIDTLGFARQGGGRDGHDALVDFLADVCKLMKAGRSTTPAFERLYAGWYHDHANAAERLDEAMRENEMLKAQCQTLEEVLAIFGGKGDKA